jgi:hypothetical protein
VNSGIAGKSGKVDRISAEVSIIKKRRRYSAWLKV